MINKELRVPNYLTEPMPLMKQWRLCDEDGYLEGNILFDMSEVITGEEEELLDLMSNRLVGDPLLSDISYKAIGIATDGSVIVNVRGNIENCDPTTSDLETICEQIKVVILNGGEDVIRDFLEEPIYGKSEKEIAGTVDEVLKSIPILDLIKYFKKYVAPNLNVKLSDSLPKRIQNPLCDQFLTPKCAETSEHTFEKKCYEAYKLQWMLAHGNTLKEMLDAINDIAAESVTVDAMNAATDEVSTKALINDAQDTFLIEAGFNGSLWVCLDEFLQTEFQDTGYMKGLIGLMDDHEEMWKFYCEHYISKKQLYYVTMKVEGRFIAEVFAENIKKAKNLATSQYMDADFGKLEDIDGDCIMVEDVNGNYLWETGDSDPEE